MAVRASLLVVRFGRIIRLGSLVVVASYLSERLPAVVSLPLNCLVFDDEMRSSTTDTCPG